MIHRIETGWLQVNDALSKRDRRERRKRGKRHGQDDAVLTGPGIARMEHREPATIDVLA